MIRAYIADIALVSFAVAVSLMGTYLSMCAYGVLGEGEQWIGNAMFYFTCIGGPAIFPLAMILDAVANRGGK